jgi:xylulokinase
MGAAVGLGLAEGDLAISLGTSGTVFAVAGHPTDDASGAVARCADARGRVLPRACALSGAKVTGPLARLLGRSRDELESLALAAPSGAGGVVLLPYLDGERTPNRPDATGTLTGLRSETAPAQLARAAYEGVVCHLLEAMDALARVGVPTDRSRRVVVGGGARSSVYPRLIADLAQRPVDVPVAAEYVARGACAQAAAVLTGRAVEEVAYEWAPDGSVVEPNDDVDAAPVRGAYAELREQTHPDPGDAR